MTPIVCVIVSAILILAVLTPFFWGPGGNLQAASSVDSVDQLEAMKEAILKRYLADEEAFAKKVISARIWEQRKTFLANRYIDTVRRLDYLRAVETEAKQQETVDATMA